MFQGQEGNELRTVLKQGVGDLHNSVPHNARRGGLRTLTDCLKECWHLLSMSEFQMLPFCLTHDQFLPARPFASPEQGGGKTKRNETQKLYFELKTQNKGGAEGLEGDKRV